ncbi:UNVERIFIED_CONTAM: hypothetical protein Sangu_3257000 [Sesamum angustifolium]|uniref:Uncharacterized protein n=1 Tax=Sesamum angustifolium TaxID=2727405 RepID=A0AAW2JCR1_9LAMI
MLLERSSPCFGQRANGLHARELAGNSRLCKTQFRSNVGQVVGLERNGAVLNVEFRKLVFYGELTVSAE